MKRWTYVRGTGGGRIACVFGGGREVAVGVEGIRVMEVCDIVVGCPGVLRR